MDITEIINQFKEGVKTSEFWFGLLAAVWVVLKTSIDPAKTWSQNFAVVAPLIGAAAYAFCRSWLKRRRTGVLDTAVGTAGPDLPPVDDVLADEDMEDTAVPPAE